MKRYAAALVCLVAAGTLLTAAGCGSRGKEGTAEAQQVVKGTVMEHVGSGAIPDLVEAVGTVKARNVAQLAARIPGTVTAVYVREGDRVAKGKLLLTLEAAETVAGAAGAQASVTEAERGLDEAKARKKLADVTFERYQKLYAEQAVTRQEFDSRQTEKDVASQGVARAEARLAQVREGAKAAGTLAGYSRVSAPISGIVTAKPADVGMTVFPGAHLMTVEEEGHYRLEVAAPESLRGKVRTGETVPVTIDGIEGTLAGRVGEVVPAVDPASRTFTAKLDVAAKGLRSGVYGRASFAAGSRSGIMVPRSAVVVRGALTSVWAVDRGNIARMRLVKTGRALGDKVEILSGLSDGERIVVSGIERVTDGARIE
ncbi:MAG TPA: efflux RND transporter periplasmic adaptor subunit [Geobacteraceae bacterium]|nr:efflux RND transporter periplasmic adaptor subunit [Geobacteraceae bacterium]